MVLLHSVTQGARLMGGRPCYVHPRTSTSGFEVVVTIIVAGTFQLVGRGWGWGRVMNRTSTLS